MTDPARIEITGLDPRITVNQTLIEVNEASPPVITLPAAGVTITAETPGIHLVVPSTAGQVTVAGIQGPEGIPGSSPQDLRIDAPSAISAHRALSFCSNESVVQYADSSDTAQAGKFLGISLNAATPGDPLDIRISGEITEPGWAWALGCVYVGAAGHLTQTMPTTGYLQAVGVALTPTKLLVHPLQPILL